MGSFSEVNINVLSAQFHNGMTKGAAFHIAVIIRCRLIGNKRYGLWSADKCVFAQQEIAVQFAISGLRVYEMEVFVTAGSGKAVDLLFCACKCNQRCDICI